MSNLELIMNISAHRQLRGLTEWHLNLSDTHNESDPYILYKTNLELLVRKKFFEVLESIDKDYFVLSVVFAPPLGYNNAITSDLVVKYIPSPNWAQLWTILQNNSKLI